MGYFPDLKRRGWVHAQGGPTFSSTPPNPSGVTWRPWHRVGRKAKESFSLICRFVTHGAGSTCVSHSRHRRERWIKGTHRPRVTSPMRQAAGSWKSRQLGTVRPWTRCIGYRCPTPERGFLFLQAASVFRERALFADTTVIPDRDALIVGATVGHPLPVARGVCNQIASPP